MKSYRLHGKTRGKGPPGLKAQARKTGFIAALKTLRHPNQSFSTKLLSEKTKRCATPP
jgi:hypothetical protein